ncbi:MAG TPA: outer membrane protein transport protein [Gemmatimonadaceae bacterium]|nr:outer membrane protein transport protein [Gemmatimonadaceae bacterium]
MKLTRAFARSLALLGLAVPAALGAQGFGLNEIGSCAVARGHAVTAAPCDDPSAIYWNPASPATMKGWSVYAGVAAIAVGGEFSADTTGAVFEGDVPTEYPPHLFVNYGADRWAAGLGVYVPYGLTSQWKDDFPGRFSAKKASLASIYIQPNLAYQLAPGWSIGGGPIIGHSSVELIQAIDLSQQPAPGLPVTFAQFGIAPGTEFARARLEGSAWAYGFNVGVHGVLAPNVQIGARYLSKLKFDYDDADATFTQTQTNLTIPADLTLPGGIVIPAGTPVDAIVGPQFTTGGALVSQKVSTSIEHPAQFQIGLGFTGIPRTTLSAEYVWIGWKAFKELPVEFKGPASGNNRILIEDFSNTWGVRTGAQYDFMNGWAGRAGFSYARTPAPDVTVTPLLPDMDRYNYSLGLGIPLGDRFKVDASYLRVDTEGRRGRIVERPTRSLTAAQLNTGFYTLDANIFSLSLRAQF